MPVVANRTSTNARPQGYMAHVDGLRCIAILSVVIFHSGIPILPGGFVGVDIFFVISGFLIMSGLDREVRGSGIQMKPFYMRRIRRLIPALLPLLICVLVAGVAILTPAALKALAASTLATLMFGSNIYFSTKPDYFSGISETLPLLHTWSLAVEEQFYIVVPALTALLWRWFGRHYAAALAALAVVSFGLALLTVHTAPIAAFYFMPLRAWELLSGGLVGIIGAKVSPSARIREGAAVFGLVFIALSISLYHASMPFPGLAAAPPVIGAALLLWADLNGRTFVGRLLSTKLMVWIGGLSYALYLWHWPIFVYARLLNFEDLSIEVSVCLIALAIGMGWFSTRVLEDRVQRAFAGRRALTLLLPTVAVAALIGAVAAALFLSNGWPARRPAVEWQTGSREAWRNQDAATCFTRTLNGKQSRTAADIRAGHLCSLGASGPRLDFLLWGDSHAEAIRPAYDAAGKRLGLTGAFVGEGGCPPIPGIDDRSRGSDFNCIETNQAVMSLIRNQHVPLVVMHSRWVGMFTPAFFVQTPRGEVHGDDLTGMTEALVATIDTLRANGTRVVVMGAMPEAGYNVPEALVGPPCCVATASVLHTRTSGRDKARAINRDVLSPALLARGIPFIDPLQVYCPTDNCPVSMGKVPTYYDYVHVSRPGALLFTEAAMRLLKAGQATASSPSSTSPALPSTQPPLLGPRGR